jgi:DNA mismatch repair protein MutS
MNAEYLKLSKHYVKEYGSLTAVFLQVGSFYELYDIRNTETGEGETPMRRAVEILGIQIVEKKGGLEISAGFPDYSLHKHASMLTRQGWTVAVIDQVRKGGKITARSVARILSPGTHVECITTDAVYMGGLWMEEPTWGTAAAPTFATAVFDFTTGDVKTYETVAKGSVDAWSADDLVHFFQVHSPRELVVWYRGAAISQPSEDMLRRSLGLFTTTIHIRMASPLEQGALEKEFVREEVLREFFRSKSLLPTRINLQIQDTPLTERVLVNLCRCIQEHYPSATDVSKIHKMYFPQKWIPTHSVFLGNHALTQLNMVTPNRDGVVDLFMHTATAFGKRAMRERILYPICSPEELEARYTHVESFDELEKDQRRRLDFILKSLCDLPRTHRKLLSYSVEVVDVLALDQTYSRTAELFTFLQAPTALQNSLKAYHELFKEQFDIEKGVGADKYTFCFQKEVAPKTWAAEQACHQILERAGQISDFICQWVGIPSESLKVDFEGNLEIRLQGTKLKHIITTKLKDTAPLASEWKKYQIKVNKVAADDPCTPAVAAPAPFKSLHVNVRKSMQSSIECDEIDSLRTLLARQAEALAAAIYEELPIVCDRILERHTPLLREIESWLASVDIAYTVNRVSKDLGFCRPRLDTAAAATESFFEIRNLRHPLIEKSQAAVEYVTHNLALTREKVGHLIYGVNASGKSSLMKSCGIAVLLAQAGCFVPATEFRFWPFKKVFTRIQNNDNLWAGLSSFAVEMTELREILQIADANTLVLGDEVCNGTESTSATALVGATLEHLHDVGAKFLFATHLHGLLSLPRVPSMPGLAIWHLQVRYDPVTQKLIYDRSLREGAGDSLYGLEVARAMNLPHTILERAIELRNIYMGTARTEKALSTDWNRQLVRHMCGVCKNPILRDLEVHHIRQQSEAGADGRFDNGLHKNHLSNLIVVCQKCHDDHHSGKITIGPARQTSDGMEREITVAPPAPAAAAAAAIVSTEEKVIEYIQRYPRMKIDRLHFELERKEGIYIHSKKLRAIRKKVPSALALQGG